MVADGRAACPSAARPSDSEIGTLLAERSGKDDIQTIGDFECRATWRSRGGRAEARTSDAAVPESSAWTTFFFGILLPSSSRGTSGEDGRGCRYNSFSSASTRSLQGDRNPSESLIGIRRNPQRAPPDQGPHDPGYGTLKETQEDLDGYLETYNTVGPTATAACAAERPCTETLALTRWSSFT